MVADVLRSPLDRAALLAWGAANRRDLPWRRTRDPWSVLVSEVMLQQTGVERVMPHYLGFMSEYPDPAALAAAPLSAVLQRWQGLGYPRRARDLRAAATWIADQCGGTVPDSLDELLALPGVGPYTARAVLVFAHEMPFGVLDTNVGRVLARWSGHRLRAGAAQSFADELVERNDPWGWNQTMFDFAATVCTRRSPRCAACPVAHRCSWAGHGPDPAVGSAGVSRPQSRFEGSPRQARGRLLSRLADGDLPIDQVDDAVGESLEADGLIVRRDGRWAIAD